MQQLSDRLAQLSSRSLAAVAIFCVIQFAFAVQLQRWFVLQLAPIIAALMLVLALKLKPAHRVRIAFVAVACVGGTLLAELFLVWLYNSPPGSGTEDERIVDPRTKWEFVQDMREQGMDIYGLDVSTSPPLLDGEPAAYLSGISNRTFATCKESGRYVILTTDEHGFLNPAGLWASDNVDIVAIGDSFTAGDCVPAGDSLPDRVRERFPSTINLGLGGNSPLGELASLVEYGAVLEPNVVVWCYHDNDLYDLTRDKRHPILPRYLDVGFRQNLYEKREQIDDVLKRALLSLERQQADSWPRGLSSVGLTRSSTPHWVQDLVTGEAQSAAAQMIRLDNLNARLEVEYDLLTAEPHDFALLEEILSQAKMLVESWGGQLYLVYLPSWSVLKFPVHRNHPLQERVFEIAGEIGIPVVDPREQMKSRRDVDRLFFYPHSHYNETGYRIAAGVVIAFLESEQRAGRLTLQTSGK